MEDSHAHRAGPFSADLPEMTSTRNTGDGDTDISYSCGSCSDNHDIFRCGQKGECDFGPDSGSRRHCQLCRFNKCLRYDYN